MRSPTARPPSSRNTVRFPNGSWGHGIFMMTSDGAPGAIEVAYNQDHGCTGDHEWGNYSDLRAPWRLQQNRGEAGQGALTAVGINIHDNSTPAPPCARAGHRLHPNGTFYGNTNTLSNNTYHVSEMGCLGLLEATQFLTLADFQISLPWEESAAR